MKVPEIKMKLPKNAYVRTLTSSEVKELLADGWQQRSLSACHDCFGRGCDHCNRAGVIGSYWKEDKYYFGTPSFGSNDKVGAQCNANYFGLYDQRLHVTANGSGGQAEIIFTMPQMFEMMSMLANIIGNMDANHKAEFGVEASFRGPPAMSLASLTKDRVTVAIIPSENQAKAIEVLRTAGLEQEARLLLSAFEHEIFRGDEEENRKARNKVGDVEPGTIMSRKGTSAIVGDVAVNVDSDKSMLSMMNK